MKIYSFVASEKKDEMILGLGFSAALMLPAVLLSTIAWLLIPGYNPVSKEMSGLGWVALPAMGIWLFLLHLLKKFIARQYTVELQGGTIAVYALGKLQYGGKVVSVSKQQNNVMIRLNIRLETDRSFSLIIRPRENPQKNDLIANGSLADVQEMEEFYQDLLKEMR